MSHGSDCGCSLEFCKPKDNGTCATCGGWLPGRRDDTPWGRRGPTLTEMWADTSVERASGEFGNSEATTVEFRHQRFPEATDPTPAEQIEDELADYDPLQEGGGGPCERCGYVQDPWRYSRLCQACIWDEAGAR